jgi:hypothetical protein
MVWNRSRDLELNDLGPLIGSLKTNLRFADVGAEGGYYGEEEESEEESQEVEVNSRI